MQGRYAIIENFFADAEALRQAVDRHFADPMRHSPERHQVWNYWYVPGSYTYLRTTPEKIVGQDLAQRFYNSLQQVAFETWGLGKTTSPYLSLYVTGCHQGLHNDARGGRLGYVYSLTRWSERRFAGGETLLFADDGPWDEKLTSSKATTSFYDLVPQTFNQLLVFDDRVPHAVPRIEGTMDPSEGRIVLHGHLSEAGPTIEGGLGGDAINRAIAKPLAEFRERVRQSATQYHGLLVIRLEIGRDNSAATCSLLFDRVMSRQRQLAPFPSAELAALFAECRFPPAERATRVTIPFAIGEPLP